MFDRILLNQTWPGDQPVLISPSQKATWGEMTDLVRSLDLDELGLVRHRVGMVFRPVPACIAALALLDRLECDTFLMDGRLGRDDAIRLGTELKLSTVLIGSDALNSRTIEPVTLACELPGSGRSSVTILTSGTTGKPKAARHTWSSLSRPVRVAVHPTGPRWLLTYRPHLYAGIQVVLQCLVNGGTLVVPEPDASPSAVAELMRSASSSTRRRRPPTGDASCCSPIRPCSPRPHLFRSLSAERSSTNRFSILSAAHSPPRGSSTSTPRQSSDAAYR